MQELTFSVRDVWRTPRLGASGKKMWVAFKGISYGYICYLLLGYISYMLAGSSPAAIWRLHRFFPAVPPDGTGFIPVLIWDLGAVLFLLFVLIGATGVAKITYRQLKGDNFYGKSDAWKYAIDHSRSTVMTPLLIGVLFGALCLALWILGWVASIPGIGPVVLGLSAIPAFVVGLLAVYVALAFTGSFLYAPAVIGTTGDDALEGAIQMFSLLWSAPWRTAGYTAVVLATSMIAAYILATAALTALSVIGGVVAGALGPSFDSIAAGAVSYLPFDCPILKAPPDWMWPGPLAGLLPVVDPMSPPAIGAQKLASLLGGVSLIVVMGGLISYVLSCLASGFTASYVTIRKYKDGEDLLEWTDEVDDLEETEARV